MSKEYEIDCEDITYFIEAEPVIDSENFDDVRILSVYKKSRKTAIETKINDEEFRTDTVALEYLRDDVFADWDDGKFD